MHRQARRQTDRQACRQAGRQADRQTDRQAIKQRDKQTDRQIDRQIDDTDRYVQKEIYTGRRTQMQTKTETDGDRQTERPVQRKTTPHHKTNRGASDLQEGDVSQQALLQAQILELLVPLQHVVQGPAPAPAPAFASASAGRWNSLPPPPAQPFEVIHQVVPARLDHLNERQWEPDGKQTRRQAGRRRQWGRRGNSFIACLSHVTEGAGGVPMSCHVVHGRDLYEHNAGTDHVGFSHRPGSRQTFACTPSVIAP